MQVNAVITNKDFSKVVFKRKRLFQTLTLNRPLVQCNYCRRTRFVTRSSYKTCLVTHSIRLTTRSTHLPTRSTRLSTRSNRFSTCSTNLFTRSTRLSIRLSTRSICLSTRSTRSIICRSFYNWSFASSCTE